ncbi:unnamed protein product [Discosporangium mesarthrocarpum]
MAYRGPSSQSQEEPTYVDDFMDAVANVPNDIKRNYILIRTLDKSAQSIMTDLDGLQKTLLSEGAQKIEIRGKEGQDFDPKAEVDNPVLMSKIRTMQASLKQIVDEKVAIADQTKQIVEQQLQVLTTSLQNFEQTLQNTGEFDMVGAGPGDAVAIQLDPGDEQWILARVLQYYPDVGNYKVMDEDDNSKTYELPEQQVIPLEGRQERLAKGDEVLAVYTDTTSFYQATVMIPPRRGANIGNGGMAHVQFVDDADEFGVTPARPVPAKHVLKKPLG